MARFLQLRRAIAGYALMLIASGLSGCSTTMPSDTGPMAASEPAGPYNEQAKLGSGRIGAAKDRSGLARAAAPKEIDAKNRRGLKHRSNVAQNRPIPDRSQPSDHAVNAKPDSKISTDATPSSSMKSPVVDSPEWKRDQQESDKQEQHIKRVIEGVCSGC